MDSGAPGRHETAEERADRNWNELLQELRVTETGATVLLSLLLTVPFAARFGEVTALQRRVYFVALLLTAAACVALIAPVAHHRLRFGKHEKAELVARGGRAALSGLVLLLLAVVAILLLVSDVLFPTGTAVAVAASFGAVTFAWWFLPPAALRLRRRR